MSKNKGYQGKRADIKPVTETIEEIAVARNEAIPEEVKEEIALARDEEVIAGVGEIVEAVDMNVEEIVVVTEPTIGEVANCDKLYVRKGPSKEAEPIRIIDKGYKVEIDELVVVPNGWLKVRFIDEYNDGGYCMEKYIKVIN